MTNPAGSGTTSSPTGSARSVPDPSQDFVTQAVDGLDAFAEELRARTGVPGMAIGVVHAGQVRKTEGYGHLEKDKPAEVTRDTVFQLASLSKPIGASVLARLITASKGEITWDDPVYLGLPNFALADEWVTRHVTIADLYSHRSGLPDHAGDLLEDIGYDRRQVIDRLRFEDLEAFRGSYAYTNFGLTAAAESVANRAGVAWADLSHDLLYRPLGMTSTSSTYAGFLAHENRATGHQPIASDSDEWRVSPMPRQPDAQSPAGGVSSNVVDLCRWLLMQLAGGAYPDRQEGISAEALAVTRWPQAMMRRPAGDVPPAWYGLGMNVGWDADGRLTLSHSGAFGLGAGTACKLIPSLEVGIVVLTNGAPLGIAEAVVETFVEQATTGAVSRDWYAFIRPHFEAMTFPKPSKDFDHPPAAAKPAGPAALYTGTYSNEYLGDVVVSADGYGGLHVTLGPPNKTDKLRIDLRHYDGNEFSWQFVGENAGPRSSVLFSSYGHEKSSSLYLETFDDEARSHRTRSILMRRPD